MPKYVPEHFKRLTNKDILHLPMEGEDFLAVTKQEVANIVRTFIRLETNNFGEDLIQEQRVFLKQKMETAIELLSKDIQAYIDYRMDKLAENICEKLLSRGVEQEINTRVAKRIEEYKASQRAKGKF